MTQTVHNNDKLVSDERADIEAAYIECLEVMPGAGDLAAGFVTKDEAFDALVVAFPSLRALDLGRPGEPAGMKVRMLDAWATGPDSSDGARHAASFVLHVYNASYPWKVGDFNFFAALRAWDAYHLAAFRAWSMDPFIL